MSPRSGVSSRGKEAEQETICINVSRLGGLGDGVSTHAGRSILIPKSAPGDVLRVRITGTVGEHDYAEIVEIVTPSPERISPPCPHYSACGSCLLQHLDPRAYRAFKERRLAEALARAGYADTVPEPLQFLPSATRRRASFRLIRDANGIVQLAYASPRSHRLTSIDACLILAPRLAEALPAIKAALQQLPDPLPRALQLTSTDSGSDAVFDDANNTPSPVYERFAREAKITRLSLRDDARLHTIVPGTVTLSIGGHDVPVPPGAFLQASEAGQDALTGFVLEATQDAKNIADLFCGIGTYALPLSARGAKVSAYEIDSAMVRAIPNAVNAQARNLFKQPLNPQELQAFDAVVINPPRAGASTQCAQLAKSNLRTIVMISCNPATFARDANVLREGGYMLKRVQGIDQFVWSEHLEIAAVFTRA